MAWVRLGRVTPLERGSTSDETWTVAAPRGHVLFVVPTPSIARPGSASPQLATVYPLRPLAAADDRALLAALHDGDPSAPASFFDRYASLVERTIVRIVGVDAEVADLVNDAFMRAMQRIDRVVDGEALRPWLTSIAVFAAREHVRARRRKWWLRFFAPEEIPEAEAPVASPELRQAVQRLYRALDALPVDDRIAFTLRHMEEMELTEVAEACATSLSTAKRRIARAEKRFLAIGRKDPLLSAWIEGGVRWSTR